MRRFLALLCGVCLLWGLTGCSDGGRLTVYDSQGAVIATLSKMDFPDNELSDSSHRSYIELALNEALHIIAATHQCDTAQAAVILFDEDYTLHTAFDPTIHAAIDTAYTNNIEADLPFGCTVVDYDGNVRAAYSGGDQSYVLMGHAPFSTIKPLSVYAPGIEYGVIDWSTNITDKPYKQIENDDGVLTDWPSNPSGGYTYKKTPLLECIKQSLNTTAVHCLKSIGVEKSIRFLQESFGMNLAFEQNKLTLDGEDEVIGNIALGYLYTGVTPVNLAGYYQIFGNGGQYNRPHAITGILDQNGQAVYTHKNETKQVIREDTAYIMNRLLSGVVTPGGTGAKAEVPDTELVGKTGTGNEAGNWFVGVTPQYSCAVWHGGGGKFGDRTPNNAAALFTEVMKNMPKHTVTRFPLCSAVRKGVYCSQSGLLFSSSCTQMQIGYYADGHKPATCDAH